MGDDLDLDVHLVLTQLRDTNGGPQRLVVGHPLAEVADHCAHGLGAQRDMVRGDAEDLRPALAARVAEAQVDVGERLVDLGVEVC